MKILGYIGAVISTVLSLTGCRQETVPDGTAATQAEYRSMSMRDAKIELDADPTIVLVDVRTPQEHREQRIPNSLLLPLADIPAKATQVLPDKDAKIFLYCRSGNRSRQAAMMLLSMGYTNVYDIGGIIDWPFETERGN